MPKHQEKLSRRKLLARAGLAAGAVYVAPVMIGFGAASASGISRASRPSRPSRASRPSRPSRPRGFDRRRISRVSRPSRHRGGWQRSDELSPIWLRQMLGLR